MHGLFSKNKHQFLLRSWKRTPPHPKTHTLSASSKISSLSSVPFSPYPVRLSVRRFFPWGIWRRDTSLWWKRNALPSLSQKSSFLTVFGENFMNPRASQSHSQSISALRRNSLKITSRLPKNLAKKVYKPPSHSIFLLPHIVCMRERSWKWIHLHFWREGGQHFFSTFLYQNSLLYKSLNWQKSLFAWSRHPAWWAWYQGGGRLQAFLHWLCSLRKQRNAWICG